jgi:hypothetical protein
MGKKKALPCREPQRKIETKQDLLVLFNGESLLRKRETGFPDQP